MKKEVALTVIFIISARDLLAYNVRNCAFEDKGGRE